MTTIKHGDLTDLTNKNGISWGLNHDIPMIFPLYPHEKMEICGIEPTKTVTFHGDTMGISWGYSGINYCILGPRAVANVNEDWGTFIQMGHPFILNSPIAWSQICRLIPSLNHGYHGFWGLF